MKPLETEARSVYADYRAVREEYSGLDRTNPLHKRRRMELKAKYNELNDRYARLMTRLHEAREKPEVTYSSTVSKSRRDIPIQAKLGSPARRVEAGTVKSMRPGRSALSAPEASPNRIDHERTIALTPRTSAPSPSSRESSKRRLSPGEGEVTMRVVALGGWLIVITGAALAASFSTGYGQEAVLSAFEAVNVRVIADVEYGLIASGVWMAFGAALIGVSIFVRGLMRLMAPIHELARKGRADAVEHALALGVDVNARDKRGCTPLHFAVVAGQEATAAFLLENGADTEALNEHGEAPLFMAAANRDLPLLRLLLENGADVHSTNENGSTLLHVAAWAGDLDLMKVAEDYGLDRQERTNAGYTPLHFAAQNGNREILEHLLAAGVDPDANCDSGITPLCVAARNGHIALVCALIEAGANVNVKPGSNYGSPLAAALENKRLEVVELLEKHGGVLTHTQPAA